MKTFHEELDIGRSVVVMLQFAKIGEIRRGIFFNVDITGIVQYNYVNLCLSLSCSSMS